MKSLLKNTKDKKIKCYVLTISKYFPATHPRGGDFTFFEYFIKQKLKKHTIRSNYDLWAKRIAEIQEGKAYLSVREWTLKPYKSKQKVLFEFFKESDIGVQKLEDPSCLISANINNAHHKWSWVAENDGLKLDDFQEWFKARQKEPMAIIHFTEFRY
jgi:hypothetical protein